jgi:hypothetical protein
VRNGTLSFGAALKRLKQKRDQRLSFWHSGPIPK